MPKRSIILTNRPPVIIDEDQWLVLAMASDSERDYPKERYAKCTSIWTVEVLCHSDRRIIVHALYTHSNSLLDGQCYNVRRGELLSASTTTKKLCKTIRRVCCDVAAVEHYATDADRWSRLVSECFANMPAEEL